MTPPTKKPWRARLGWGLTLALVAWLGLSFLVARAQTRRGRAPYPEPVPKLPWGKAEGLRLATADGEDLGAWFIEGHPDRPAVLLMHGWGGNRSWCLYAARLAASAGCPVLLVTARAHGDSSGDVNDFGYSARRDILAGVDWLHARRPGGRVVVWGQSLGSAAALFAADEAGERVSGYVIECPYRDLWTALRNRTRLYLPPVAELVAYVGVAAVAPLVLPHADAISPEEAAGRVPASARVLILAGGADSRAWPEEAAAIAGRIGANAELEVFEGADHMKLEKADPERYREAVLRLLGRCYKAAP